MSIRVKNYWQTFLRNIPLLGCFVTVFFCFRALSGTAVAIFFLSFFFLYMLSMIASSHGVIKLEEYDYALTTKKRLKFSILASFPCYPMWLVSSLFPIKTWYAWVVTGFPLIVVGTLPIFELCDEYWRRAPKMLLWACHFGVYILCFLIGQTIQIILE